MRATYEDLLRAARRTAVSAQRGIYPDQSEVMADWNAVLAATRNHLRWLRVHLKTERGASKPVVSSGNALGRLAQAIGAGADLLAVQDSAAAGALDVREDLIAARAEVAAIALMGARVVVRNTAARTPGRSHLRYVMKELELIAEADVRRAGLGGLGLLAAGGPAALASSVSRVGPLAARWERAHASVATASALTRELRSTTAQLRTVGGQVWHVATHLLSSPSAGLEAGQRFDLQVIRTALRGFDAGTRHVARAWRRRLCDLNGQGNSLSDVAFLDLKDSIEELLRDGYGRSRPDPVRSHRSAVQLIDAVDELLWSAEQVARHQQHTVDRLIAAGRLFVPRHEAAQVELSYLRRPGGGARLLQPWWVRTDSTGCFDELTDALADAADRLKVASDVARRLAGTSELSRRTADPVVRTSPPYVDIASRIADQGQEFAGPGR
jgi:hypothetical protein